MLRTVGALDDVHAGIVLLDELLDLGVALAVGLGEEDVGGAAQMLDGLAQDAAGQQVAVAEGIGFVDEQEVQPALERQVLEAVVEHERVAAEAADRIGAGLHAVFVDQHDHAREIARQHVGLVAGLFGIEQHALAIAHHARRRLLRVREAVPRPAPEGGRLALVAAAEDGDAAAALGQRTGKLFHHRRLAGAAHRQVADHDHQAAQRLIVQQPLPVEPEPQLHHPAEQKGHPLQKRPVDGRPGVLPPPKDHIDGVLLEGVILFPQPGWRHAMTGGIEG